MAHVTFIHGIGNKPPGDLLLDGWERTLAHGDGIDLGTRGITSRMVYWADVLYAEASYTELESVEPVVLESEPDPDMAWRLALSGPEADWVESLAKHLAFDAPAGEMPPESEIGVEFERIPLPGWMKRRLMKTLLRDVHHYLFNAPHSPRPEELYEVREEVRRRMLEALQEATGAPGPHIVVSHSMGTVIAYDCLKRVPGCPPVDGLVTIGSPLGMEDVPIELRPEWTPEDGFPAERLEGRWVNVFDRFDPVVGLKPQLAERYRHNSLPVVEDINEQNWGAWRHDIAKYLQGPELRRRLAELLEL